MSCNDMPDMVSDQKSELINVACNVNIALVTCVVWGMFPEPTLLWIFNKGSCLDAFCPTEQDRIPVLRGQWFIDGTWTPMEEDESDLIEKEHLMCFRGQQMQDSLENDVVAKTTDSKDGKHAHHWYSTLRLLPAKREREHSFACVCVWDWENFLSPFPDIRLHINRDAAVCKPHLFCDGIPAIQISYEWMLSEWFVEL